MSMSMLENALRAELTRISKRAYDQGLVRGSGGNVSARLDEPFMLVTPSGVTLGDTSVDNIVKANITTGEWLPNDPYIPSKEYRFHAAIYQARPDVNAIVHCHPPHATAYAVKKIDIPQVTDAAFKQPAMPHVPFAPSGSAELVQNIATAIEGNTEFKVIMLDEHGIVSVGKDLMTAFLWADLAEEMAQIAFIASQLSQNRP